MTQRLDSESRTARINLILPQSMKDIINLIADDMEIGTCEAVRQLIKDSKKYKYLSEGE